MNPMDHPESIYNLIPKEKIKHVKPPRYISTFREQVKAETRQHKSAHKTMGPAKVRVPSPEKYLLKHSKEPKMPEKKPFTYPDGTQRPEVPRLSNQPLTQTHTTKDFITTNAIKNIKAVPKKPQPFWAHTKHGDKQPLLPSGLVPKYVKKKEYGETPKYLLKRREDMKRAQEEYDIYAQERIKQGPLHPLSEEEQRDLVQRLKENWEALHKQYQGLSVVIDNLPKKHRKLRLEKEMKMLEQDISTIEKHKIVYSTNE